ncbi:MAG: hypothetical protein VKK62_04125 [Synechococcaceae cyanobacterium]|nr:hypothetical protein [Synechococcaceae cyanobacterium]
MPLVYSWILNNQLAIGPMPRCEEHWQQLEQAGFSRRFSCCYAEEEIYPAAPPSWRCAGISLPDHREQEPLEPQRLIEAIHSAEELLEENSPTYLHCLAGRERSALMAVALTSRRRQIDIFESLDWVRRCHPTATPIYDHLEVLDQVLRQLRSAD